MAALGPSCLEALRVVIVEDEVVLCLMVLLAFVRPITRAWSIESLSVAARRAICGPTSTALALARGGDGTINLVPSYAVGRGFLRRG
jgi:hypothetical protein